MKSLILITAAIPTTAVAQPFAIAQHSFPCGGATDIAAGNLNLGGALGQSLAGDVSAPPYSLTTGFWTGGEPGAPPCYANCDGSTNIPVLNVNDFTCFLNHYAAASSLANCDGSTTAPVLNVNDFTCFLNSYAQGCP